MRDGGQYASYTRPERILMKGHPEYNEKWVQDCIAKDPTILGLGDLVLRETCCCRIGIQSPSSDTK